MNQCEPKGRVHGLRHWPDHTVHSLPVGFEKGWDTSSDSANKTSDRQQPPSQTTKLSLAELSCGRRCYDQRSSTGRSDDDAWCRDGESLDWSMSGRKSSTTVDM